MVLALVILGSVTMLLPFLASAMIQTEMQLGSEGADVAELQKYYAAYGTLYPSGLITSYFGELTEAATQRFQINQGIVSSGTPDTTGYGRVGPRTAARINALMAVNTTLGDVWSPIISKETVVTTKNSATISWATSETAQSRVMYGKSWPFVYASAKSVRAGEYETAPRITLSNLEADTVYYYIRESIDAYGNITWTTKETFRTENSL